MTISLSLRLVDLNPSVVAAWRATFLTHDPRTIIHGSFESALPVDCFITAGNSFGLMDGGIDLAVARRFPGIENRVQDAIETDWLGELPVGASLLVPTGHPSCPWLAYAPTMRVPMAISGTDAVYRAFWTALVAISQAQRSGQLIHSIATTGLGALTGRVPPTEAARQMLYAWNHLIHGRPRDWHTAIDRHRAIIGLAP